jgi:hypothetical protein
MQLIELIELIESAATPLEEGGRACVSRRRSSDKDNEPDSLVTVLSALDVTHSHGLSVFGPFNGGH